MAQDQRPNKKRKAARLNNFPPEFWDDLLEVPLTRRALRELDRRNRARTAGRARAVPEASAQPAPGRAPAAHTTALGRFARSGGPDLCHLRGCPEPGKVGRTIASSSSAPPSGHSTSPQRSSAYDKVFEQHLEQNHVYLHGRKSKPNNNNNSADLLQTTRPSLSLSQFSDGRFERFQVEHDYIGSEHDVMRKIIPVISGDMDIPNSGEVLFANLASITNGATVDAMPDFYDGTRYDDIDTTVGKDLGSLIIPSSTNVLRRPAAPNFFLEAKAPWGGADVAKRQAGLDGAIGARAMHALQNYRGGGGEPSFDGNAYAYSSTYNSGTGTLQLYAHHVTAPTAPGGRPEYHMTQVGAFAMTGHRDGFVQGATFFRNARDLAQRHRDRFVQAANARARQPRPETRPEAEIIVAGTRQYEESRDGFADCEDHVGRQAEDEEHGGSAAPRSRKRRGASLAPAEPRHTRHRSAEARKR